MASEAINGQAGKSSTSPAPSADEAVAAGLPSARAVGEGSSHAQQAHVSDASAEASQQQQQQQQRSSDNGGGNGDGDGGMAASQATTARQKANTVLCGICESNPGKYKCSRCRLPYKTHQRNHPPDAPKPTSQAPNEPNASAPPPPPPALPPPLGRIDPANPFSALATSDKLQLLFQKYPNLPNQLLEIHAATQPPSEAPDAAARAKAIPASLMKGLAAKNPGRATWNHDVGIRNGKAALRRARKANGEDGEAIREYTELILHIMDETGDKGNAAAYVQRQVAEQDTALIERLLAEDRRNE
ncbi:hypothetical protein Trco_004314 [Trichoderma cornu-damae]|uniref:HIT-type domain-containing protein n=1 Tax=Trichoderma cornu-damae TaxID=654480 RepID=A0A9P8TU22_9HYPO|nr:hypothetical protein Trco_004314 [Trichoderma cornu-damae]